MTIYQDLITAGCKVDHHESDLYVEVTPLSRMLIANYRFKDNVTRFCDVGDGKQWFDIPFAFDPFYDKYEGLPK